MFCLECNQSICRSCVDSHRRIKQIQRHTLVDKRNKKATIKIAKVLSSIQTCKKHPDKNIELLCVDHDMLCCSRCLTIDHRGCHRVKDLSVDDAVTSSQDVLLRLNDAKMFMTALVKGYQTNNEAIKLNIYSTIPEQIQEMRASIN